MSDVVTDILNRLQAVGWTVLNVGPRWSDLVQHNKHFDIRLIVRSEGGLHPELHVVQANGSPNAIIDALMRAQNCRDTALCPVFAEYEEMDPTRP